MDDNTLYIAEVTYENGNIKFRFSQYMSEDGMRWIRHGLFQAFHENGNLASEGMYQHGSETGMWNDYHDNGQLAAQGEYEEGKEIGVWHYWDHMGNSNGSEEIGA